MGTQGELIPDPIRQDLRQLFRDRSKGRRNVQPSTEIDALLRENVLTVDTLKRYARRALVKEWDDVLMEINRETGISDFEKLPGTDSYAQIELMTYEEYSGRALEILGDIEHDVSRVWARVQYCKRRWGKVPKLPRWFLLAAKASA